MTELPRSQSLVQNSMFSDRNKIFDRISVDIDGLIEIGRQATDSGLLFALGELLGTKLKVIDDLKKAFSSSTLSLTNYNNYIFQPSVVSFTTNREVQQMELPKKFQLRADAPSFQPSSHILESLKQPSLLESSCHDQTKLILFPSDKHKSVEATKPGIVKPKATPFAVPANHSTNFNTTVHSKVIAKPLEKKRSNSMEIKSTKDEWDDEILRKQVKEATEKVWAEAEAWIDAEAEAEENEWRILEMGINRYVGLSDKNDTSFSEMSRESHFFYDKIFSTSHHDKKIESLTLDSLDCVSLLDDGNSTFSSPLKPNEGNTFSPSTSAKGTGRFHSPLTTSGRTLHEKLSSPDRKKRTLSPSEARKRYEDKLLTAETNRDKNVAEKVQKAMIVVNRVKEKMMKQAERQAQAVEALEGKLKGAEQRHSKYLSDVKEKAGSENAKVTEVMFLHTINTEVLAHQLQQRLEDVENRILAATLRREQRLAGISCSQKKKNSRKVQQMSEFKLQLEKLKMERWEKLQKRFEAVQERQRKRLEEMKRRAAAATNVVTVLGSPNEQDLVQGGAGRDSGVEEVPPTPASLSVDPLLQYPAIPTPISSSKKNKVSNKSTPKQKNQSATFSPLSPNGAITTNDMIISSFASSPSLSPSSSSAQLMLQSGRSSVSSLPMLPTNLSASLQDTYQVVLDQFYRRSQKVMALRMSLWESLLHCFHYSVTFQEGDAALLSPSSLPFLSPHHHPHQHPHHLHTISSVLGQHIYANDVWKLAQEVLSTSKEWSSLDKKTTGKTATKLLLPLKEIVNKLEVPKKIGNVERVASSYSLYFSIIVDIRNVGLFHESTAATVTNTITANTSSSATCPPSSSSNLDSLQNQPEREGEGKNKLSPDDTMIATLNYIDLIEQINFLLQNTLDMAIGTGSVLPPALSSASGGAAVMSSLPSPSLPSNHNSSGQSPLPTPSSAGQSDPNNLTTTGTTAGSGGDRLNDFIASGGVFLLCILLSYEYGILSHSQIMTNIIEDICYRHFSHPPPSLPSSAPFGEVAMGQQQYVISKANAITSWQVIDFPHLLDLLLLIVRDYIHPIPCFASAHYHLHYPCGTLTPTGDTSTTPAPLPPSLPPCNHLSEVLGCGLPIVIMELLFYFLQLQHTMHMHVHKEEPSRQLVPSEANEIEAFFPGTSSALGPNEEECMPVMRHYTCQLLDIFHHLLKTMVQSVQNYDQCHTLSAISPTTSASQTTATSSSYSFVDESINSNLLSVLYHCQQYMVYSTMFTHVVDQWKLELLVFQAFVTRSVPSITTASALTTTSSAASSLLAIFTSSSPYLISSLQFFECIATYLHDIAWFLKFTKQSNPSTDKKTDASCSRAISGSNWLTLAKQYWSIIRRSQLLNTLWELLTSLLPLFQASMMIVNSDHTFLQHPLYRILVQTIMTCVHGLAAWCSLDGDLWKAIALDQKKAYVDVCHRLLLILFAGIDQKQWATVQAMDLWSKMHDVGSEFLEGELSWTLSNAWKHIILQLLTIITTISYHDRDIRQYLSVPIALLVNGVPSHLVATWTKSIPTNDAPQQSAIRSLSLSSSFLTSIASLPIRHFKDSRLKHVLIPCLIMGSLELDQHVQLIKYHKKENFVKKFIEYVKRESESLESPQQELDTVDIMKHRARFHKVFELLPKNVWNVITLVWLDVTASQ